MNPDSISTFVTTVPADRTITVPDQIPPGARVVIVVLDSQDETARSERFEATKRAIRAALDGTSRSPEIDDAALDALVRAARRA
jgi:hypothetical protein